MGNFGRDDNRGGFSRGGFNRGSDRGGFRGGRSSFGGSRPPAQRAYGSASGFGGGRDDRGPREMFKTTCSNCGKDCEVPFRPTNGKPVYCSDCFEKMGNGGRSDDRRPERSDFRPQPQTQFQAQPAVSNNAQLEALNAKLDKIISLLETKSVEPINAEVTETPAVKKIVKKSSKK